LDKKVKEYIEKQPSPQIEISLKVRKIFLKTLPDCKEKMTWGVVVFGDNKFYIAAMKTRVHVGFAINGLSQEEIKLFEGSGKTMRHIKIHSLNEIDEKKLVQLIKMVDKKAICKPC
jgi:hypothetical protein